MARRKPHTSPSLFHEQERRLERRLRRQRALFIPRLLSDESKKAHLQGPAQEHAYQIALRWADLETKGHLVRHKETSIDTQFLDQVFGDGLGYQLKTTSPDAWQLEHKITVQGIGTADAALGDFPHKRIPTAIIELKSALIDLDRDRSQGRTAVQQCWDYLNALPECTWGIVSNFSTIRLYHRLRGTLAYEEFTLQELRVRERFNEFYCIFQRNGLLRTRPEVEPRAVQLLQKTAERQREVGVA
jgi:hypothetical protein